MVKSRIEERKRGEGNSKKGKSRGAGGGSHKESIMRGRRVKGKVRLAPESLLRAEGIQFIV